MCFSNGRVTAFLFLVLVIQMNSVEHDGHEKHEEIQMKCSCIQYVSLADNNSFPQIILIMQVMRPHGMMHCSTQMVLNS